MDEKRVEGIVLKATPFKEADRILNLFTKEGGVISLYVRRLSKNKPALVNLTTPLCRAEFVFSKGRSDLYRFIDGTIIDMHLELRRSYKHLEVAGKMLQAIASSQMPGKASPELYALLATYLKHLPNFSDANSLWSSFMLKLLKYEGLLALDTKCNLCGKSASRIVEGESRCVGCADGYSFPFAHEEWETLITLFHAKQFDQIQGLTLEPPFLQTIEALYQSQIGR